MERSMKLHFAREYESKWSGTVEDAFFNGEVFDRNRVYKSLNMNIQDALVLLATMLFQWTLGRKGVILLLVFSKVILNLWVGQLNHLVNIYTFAMNTFEDQAIQRN